MVEFPPESVPMRVCTSMLMHTEQKWVSTNVLSSASSKTIYVHQVNLIIPEVYVELKWVVKEGKEAGKSHPMSIPWKCTAFYNIIGILIIYEFIYNSCVSNSVEHFLL